MAYLLLKAPLKRIYGLITKSVQTLVQNLVAKNVISGTENLVTATLEYLYILFYYFRLFFSKKFDLIYSSTNVHISKS